MTRKQFRALVARDGYACGVPGCSSRRRLHVHHVEHWLHGGDTDLDNEVILCEPHHRQVHEGELSIGSDSPGRFRFATSSGGVLAREVDPSSLIANHEPVEREYPDVADDAAQNRWDGSRMDRGYAVAGLAAARADRTDPPPD